MPKPLSNAIIILVAAAFAINFGAVFVVPGYQPDPIIYTVFMGVIGAAYGLQRKDKPPGDGGDKP